MQDIPFSFETAGFLLQEVPWEYRWLNLGVVTDPQQRQEFDDEGAGVRNIDGVYYLHPVGLSSFMMTRLDQYRITNDQVYLDLCIRQAERIMERSVHSREAAYVPYEFEWNLHRHTTTPMRVPWYSGMAQGQILSAFSRLYDLTGIERYLKFANEIFNSFLNLREQHIPWTVELHDNRWLWFEEYARDNGPSDRAFNGHLFAVYGLHDYWTVSKDPRAELLADGGLTTLMHYMDKWRYPGAQSYYCLSHRIRVASYHRTHIIQMGLTYNLTGETVWVKLQDLFLDDYPMQIYPQGTISNRLIIEPGTYQVGSRGGLGVSEKETVLIEERKELEFDVRGKLHNETTVSTRVTDPDFKFLWFPEETGKIYVRGITELLEWSKLVAVAATENNPTAFEFNEFGQINREVETDIASGDLVKGDRRAHIQGEDWLGIASGPWEGLWIAFDDLTSISEMPD